MISFQIHRYLDFIIQGCATYASFVQSFFSLHFLSVFKYLYSLNYFTQIPHTGKAYISSRQRKKEEQREQNLFLKYTVTTFRNIQLAFISITCWTKILIWSTFETTISWRNTHTHTLYTQSHTHSYQTSQEQCWYLALNEPLSISPTQHTID